MYVGDESCRSGPPGVWERWGDEKGGGGGGGGQWCCVCVWGKTLTFYFIVFNFTGDGRSLRRVRGGGKGKKELGRGDGKVLRRGGGGE